jgi:hypothetical protein
VVDLLVILPIGLLKLVVFLVQLVHIVEKLHILLLGLDKCCDNFLNAADSCRLHDRLKCLLNDFGVANILVQQPFLFDVFVHH